MTSLPPEYAYLPGAPSPRERSQHGTAVDLDRAYPDLTGEPLPLNGRESRSDNPNRYKQHGFHFNADNCIACHACESACSEKNQLPAHLAFRKVGYVEGGSWPDVVRVNVSMACNHCENPVCLKACPTRAYTKYAEYGAVIQDPDICFGCGYCTWVCPYNAPQLDPVNGQVEKCNMCVDRLEQGLKPACVAACLGNALEFGVIEDLPKGREQVKLSVPGFPDPAISRPNIRFEQKRSLPGDFRRTDGVPIHYHRDDQGGSAYRVKVRAAGAKPAWGFDKLSSRENPLVAFTLFSQLAIGGFVLLFLLPKLGLAGSDALQVAAHPLAHALMLFGLVGAQAAGLFLSASHLGKPHRFYRGFNNLRHSWLSREALMLSLFFGALGGYALLTVFPVLFEWLPFIAGLRALAGYGAAVLGPAALYCMYRIYRVQARPFWDHWHAGGAFFATMLILGSFAIGFGFGIAQWLSDVDPSGTLGLLALPLIAGLALQAVSLAAHARYLVRRGAEAEVSRAQMLTTYGKTYYARWASLGVLSLGAIAMAVAAPSGAIGLAIWSALFALALAHEVVGRALFYVLVTPTTMPGALFWNNRYFEQHARKTGLAKMPQVGVVTDAH
jgi:DMSO reductase iron-sulfur subunit